MVSIGTWKLCSATLNEHGDPRLLFQVFAKKSLMKNIFEEEKKFESKGEELTTELSEKVQYSRNQAIKNGLNEAILLCQ